MSKKRPLAIRPEKGGPPTSVRVTDAARPYVSGIVHDAKAVDTPRAQVVSLVKSLDTDLPEFEAYRAAEALAAERRQEARAAKEAAQEAFAKSGSLEDGDAFDRAERNVERIAVWCRSHVGTAKSAWQKACERRKHADEAADDLERLQSGKPLDKSQNNFGDFRDAFVQRNRKLASVHDLTFHLLAHLARTEDRMPTDREITETNEDVLSSIVRLRAENKGRVNFTPSPDHDQVPESKLYDFIRQENRVPTNEDIIGWFSGPTIEQKQIDALKAQKDRQYNSRAARAERDRVQRGKEKLLALMANQRASE